MTVVHVTHDKQEAFELSTQIVVLNAGRVEQVGTPEEIRGPGATPFVREFLRRKRGGTAKNMVPCSN